MGVRKGRHSGRLHAQGQELSLPSPPPWPALREEGLFRDRCITSSCLFTILLRPEITQN